LSVTALDYETKEDVTTYEGAVLATYERNMHDDSDFFAVVWDDEAGCLKDVCVGSTRHAGPWAKVEVDATDEVKAKAAKVVAEKRGKARHAYLTNEAQVAVKGDTVKVVKGRKVPVGTEAKVFWRGEDRYKSGRWATFYRVGLELPDGERVFVAEENVEKVGWEDTVPSVEELTAVACNPETETCWRAF
jgi:hypothetical protein